MEAKDKIIAWRLYDALNMKISCEGNFYFKVIFGMSKVRFLHKGVFCPFLYYVVFVDKPTREVDLGDALRRNNIMQMNN